MSLPQESQEVPFQSTLLAQVIKNLKKYGDKRPTRLVKLKNALAGSFPKSSEAQLATALEDLQAQGFVVVSGVKVTYPRFDAEV